jgi:multicomponent Na+:H+ antiporter subunit E
VSRRLVLGAVLVVAWVALWGTLSLANVVSGLLVATVIVLVFPLDDDDGATIRWGPALRYSARFVVDLVQSSLAVARLVLAPRHKITQGIVAAPIRPCSPGIVTLVANSITLTPGTLTVEVQDEPPVLYVHCLGLDDPDQVRRDVIVLQRNAILAFGSEIELARLDEPDPVVPPASEPGGAS